MPKRTADTELNHENWDQDEEVEEEQQPGISTADGADLAGRKIKVAKRRSGGRSSDADTSKGLFSGFKGFGGSKLSAKPASALFGSKKADDVTTPLAAISFPAAAPAPKSLLAGPTDVTKKTNGIEPKFGTTGEAKPVDAAGSVGALFWSSKKNSSTEDGKEAIEVSKKEVKDADYMASLKALNEGVSRWIAENVCADPHVDLTPVFDDYRKHMGELDTKFLVAAPLKKARREIDQPQKRQSSSAKQEQTIFSMTNAPSAAAEDKSTQPKSSQNFVFGAASAAVTSNKCDNDGVAAAVSSKSSDAEQKKASFNFGFLNTKETGDSAPIEGTSAGPKFNFGLGVGQTLFPLMGPATVSTGAAPLFSFAKTTENIVPEGPAKFAVPAGFSFGLNNSSRTQDPSTTAGATSNGGQTQKVAEDEDDKPYEPPKAEAVEIEEKDAFYSIRCKLFMKDEERFVDRGVGTLHLKPVENSDRTQLLVRATTALGNVLLNVSVSKELSFKRIGNNNVGLVCVPNPPFKVGEPEENPPRSVLIRVKTAEDADQLHKRLSELVK